VEALGSIQCVWDEVSVEARYSPRKLELGALLRVLIEEHEIMRNGLRRAKEARDRGDFEGVRRTFKELDPVFRQHIADEEAQILGLLIADLGVKGAEAEILVFRQHKPIYQLMKKISDLASKSPEELEKNQADLERLFDDHTLAEEERVFPKAASVRGTDRLHWAGH
jgi:hypothetical protein